MNIAIIGATGLVGREILKIINQKKILKNNNIFLYASKNSENKQIKIGNRTFVVKELGFSNLENNYNFALFAAGKEISNLWAKEFKKRGAIIIDNSSAFRREKKVPLVVPEINVSTIKDNKIIANPNCSTIGLSLPLFELGKMYKIKRVVVSTYQAVSGAGQKGINSLKSSKLNNFNTEIKNNIIPQIDAPLGNGYTYEEDKMDYELKKILNNKKLNISATCVRVPLNNCHSESVYVELFQEPNIDDIKEKFKKAKGLTLLDNVEKGIYPMPIFSNGHDEVFIGRIRKDSSNPKAISFFISFDNIRKGAALNAVQIMEFLINRR